MLVKRIQVVSGCREGAWCNGVDLTIRPLIVSLGLPAIYSHDFTETRRGRPVLTWNDDPGELAHDIEVSPPVYALGARLRKLNSVRGCGHKLVLISPMGKKVEKEIPGVRGTKTEVYSLPPIAL